LAAAVVKQLAQLLAFACVTLFMARAQAPNSITTYNGWYHYSATFKFSKKFSGLLEGQYRANNLASSWVLVLHRVGAQYQLSKSFTIGGGYVFSINYPYGQPPATPFMQPEHRPYQQLVYKHHVGHVELTHRLRTEQRYRGRMLAPDVQDGFTYSNRWRYQLRAFIPFKKRPIQQGDYYLTAGEELFLEWGPVTINNFNQNRLFVMLGHDFGGTRLEAGYLNNLVGRTGAVNMEVNHNLFINVVSVFDFTRKRKQTPEHLQSGHE
jgi:hypothetical protein